MVCEHCGQPFTVDKDFDGVCRLCGHDCTEALLLDWIRELFSGPRYRPQPSGRWFHVSAARLPAGTVLVPGGGRNPGTRSFYDMGFGQDTGVLVDMEAARDSLVWLSIDLDDAGFWAAVLCAGHVYEVKPAEEPRPWNGTGTDGWVVSNATVLREIGPAS